MQFLSKAALLDENGNVTDFSGVAKGVQIETGSYTGTGTYGSSNPNSLTFGFVPKMVIIVADSAGILTSGTVLISGQSKSSGIGSVTSSGGYLNMYVSWSEQSVSWRSGSAEDQLNTSSQKYYYFAIG